MFILVYEEIGFMNESSEISHLHLSVALVVILYIVGTIFYHTIEGWSYLESIYFITMTITTIGYGDFVPKTEISMVFTIFLALIGISVAFYLIYSIAAFREKTFDREVVSKLALFRNLTALRAGKKKPSYIKLLKSKIGEI
jgi:voltage-gated potassium channel Kch